MATKQKVSLADIAKKTGVSIGAVSRILKHDETMKVRAETRERVLKAANQLGYEPNFIAAALRSHRTGLIGALSPNLAGTFLGLLTHELQRAANAHGVELLIGSPEVESERIAAQLKKLQSLLFDGLLLLGNVLDYQATIRDLQVISKPYISVCAGLNTPAPLVNVDDEQGIEIALDYLTALGHTRIAFLSSPNWPQERYRIDYLERAIVRRGLRSRPEYLAVMQDAAYTPQARDFLHHWTVEPTRAMQTLMRLPEPPTAVFCANDGFALAALKGALQLGLRVPQDVSILGYNDEITATLFTPELTTIRQPLDKIAGAAVGLLLEIIERPQTPFMETRMLVPPELVIRQTCGPASGLT